MIRKSQLSGGLSAPLPLEHSDFSCMGRCRGQQFILFFLAKQLNRQHLVDTSESFLKMMASWLVRRYHGYDDRRQDEEGQATITLAVPDLQTSRYVFRFHFCSFPREPDSCQDSGQREKLSLTVER
ncbi:unnamed protein product [Protopolystoma xenopodis]|uniref:Uncharacterized protein n=1 Tax=Protopolystoma xenopodis TaxID=117903 RepID=A0A448WVW7_9PLAT|nr:unnamed protein product [Protopolystoma xenopodis]